MKIRGIIFLCILILSCEEGDPPDLNQYEPFVTIKFYDSLDEAVVTPIDEVSVIGYSTITYETESSKYKLPLNINASKSEFTITIGGVAESLSVEYEPRVENQFDVLRFLLENTFVSSHSFDSVKVVCEPNCISNETEIKIYR